MGTTQHKGSIPVAVLEEKVFNYNFKPYRMSISSFDSKHFCHNPGNEISPKPRSGHRVVCDDVNMYSFGGYNPSLSTLDEADLALDSNWSESKPLFRELWKYNISKGSWRKLDVKQIPDILASNAAILSGNILMIYGGTGVPFGANCSKDLYICDFRSGMKELKFDLVSAVGNCPQPQYGQAIVLINHYLYTVGGTTGFEYTCDIHRLNLKDGMWEAVYTCKGSDNEPPGRYRHEIAFDENKIYILGGGTAHDAFDFQTLFAFDLSTCSWEKISTRPDIKAREAYPAPRRCHSCVQQDRRVYIIGGFTGRLILKDIWTLDLNTFEWKKFPKLSLDRGVYFHSSCLTSSGKLITFGGIAQLENSSSRSSAVHTAWLCIPKLKEICWEAVMFYYSELDTLTEEELLLIGLPFEFIQRLDLEK